MAKFSIPSNIGDIYVHLSSNEEEIPVYDENTQTLWLPTDSFYSLQNCWNDTELLLRHWSDKRTNVIDKLKEIIETLNKWEVVCNMSTVVGSSLGLVGGAVTVGGLLLMPPLVLGGLVCGGVAAIGTAGVGVAKIINLKKASEQSKELLDHDRILLINLQQSIANLESSYDDVLKNLSQSLKNITVKEKMVPVEGVTGAALATTQAVAFIGLRVTLREVTSIVTTTMKGVMHAAVGIGMVIDLLTLIVSSKNLSEKNKCFLANELQNTADILRAEQLTLCEVFKDVHSQKE